MFDIEMDDDLTISHGSGASAKVEQQMIAELNLLCAKLGCEGVGEISTEPTQKTRKYTEAIQGFRDSYSASLKRQPYIHESSYRRIDEWRSGKGRATYNASRRKVRKLPNFNLKNMTEAEKKDHRKAQKADSAYRKRKLKNGWTEHEVSFGLKCLQAKRFAATQKITRAEQSKGR